MVELWDDMIRDVVGDSNILYLEVIVVPVVAITTDISDDLHAGLNALSNGWLPTEA